MRVPRTLRWLALLLCVGYVAVSLVVMSLEDRFIFFPMRGGQVTGPGQDVLLQADDGVKLQARYLAQPEATQTLLYLHGNAGNLANRSELLVLLAHLGVNVLALDYRGYGQSEGTPSEAGVYRDASAAYRWLRERTAPSNIVVLGESLGGGPACELALHQPVGALILQSTFTRIADMAALVFPWLPTRLILRTRFDNLAKVRRIAVPKLFIHSARDEVIPYAMGQRLFAEAAAPKTSLWLTRSGHNDAFFVETERMMSGVSAFLRGLASAPSR